MAGGNSYVGKTIGNYRVVSELASGSSGSVYLARHIILSERTVVTTQVSYGLAKGEETD